MSGASTKPLNAALAPPARRRKRAECELRIIEAARAIFAEQGYDAATTREIARRADVSETLLFRYFGSKARMFDRILFAPVGGLMNSLLIAHGPQRIAIDPVASTREFLTSLFAFADDNRTLLAAFAARQMASRSEPGSPPAALGLAPFYDLAATEIRRIHASRGTTPEVVPEIAARLSFGMVVASILFSDWLFSDHPPKRTTLIDSIASMLVHAIDGATPGEPSS